ncbi:O-antigen ligase family protein [Methylobacterium persicinum]|uniref:O-antigen ligase n=1 Tax=Methylobacterium persicinum TaxID=374426 RepID=A0ABU0HN03_9HYPH|nr:O-antigen ligase family protein [Methylobacterium persicinum]MDQ0443691.1 O-antigen ligase [Methylobacterium persicinum]GJE40182.1 hypothetical protein KHHGKMAE_4272 [Methylobacterium persicinum]
MAATGHGQTLLQGFALPLAAALALMGALVVAGSAGTLLPVALAGTAAAGVLIAGFVRGAPWGIAALLTMALLGLSLNFRVRGVGEVGLDWQNGAKLATWVVLAGVTVLRRRDLAPLLRQPCYGLAFAYAGLALASTGWSQTPAYTAANALGMVAYLGLAGLAATRMGEGAALRTMIAAISVLAAVSLAGGLLVPDLAWSPPSDVEVNYRLEGFSGHPNALGQQAAVLCLLAVAARRLRAIGTVAFLAAAGLGLATLLTSRSRFALTAFLASWAFVVLRRRPAGRVLMAGGAGLALLAAALVTVLPLSGIDALFDGLSRTGDASEIVTLTGRTDLWAAAAELIARAPLFGWGFAGTEGMLADYVPRNFVGATVNPHNMVMQTLMSLGFLGSLPAFALFALLGVKAFVRPDDLRDQVVLFVLIDGLGEVEVYGTPVLLNLVFYWALARDAAGAAPGRLAHYGRASP